MAVLSLSFGARPAIADDTDFSSLGSISVDDEGSLGDFDFSSTESNTVDSSGNGSSGDGGSLIGNAQLDVDAILSSIKSVNINYHC